MKDDHEAFLKAFVPVNLALFLPDSANAHALKGCKGSVLLNSTKTNSAEKDAMPNQRLDGFYVIDASKEALEKACRGFVSCTDIVALAARDAISLVTGSARKGSWMASNNLWEVTTGRRDGIV